MQESPYAEAKIIWKNIVKEAAIGELKFELEISKKLLDIFQAGDYYYFIFNCVQGVFEYVHETTLPILGYPPEKCTTKLIVESIHPDDLPYFLNFEGAVGEFFTKLPIGKSHKYKVRYDYRLKKADGTYLRVLQQALTIQEGEDGGVLRTIVVHTDITHLKPEGKPVLSIVGLDGEPSYLDIKPQTNFVPHQKEMLSCREKEILSLLISGNHSQQIGQRLHISPHTVNTHRRNILAKTGAGSTSELVAKAVREGWL